MLRLTQAFCLCCCLLFSALSSADGVRIFVHGVDETIKENILNRLDIVQKRYGKELSNQNIQDFYAQVPENVIKAIEPFGYFQPQVDTQLHQQGQDWDIVVSIQLGQPIIIRSVDVQIHGAGSKQPYFQTLLSELALRTNTRYSTKEYERAKRKLFSTANNHGYLDARLSKREIYIDRHQGTADITLYLETGPQYFFGAVVFEEDLLSDELLQRYVRFSPGEPYSTSLLNQLQDDLNNSGYFQRVKVEPQITAARQQKVPIYVAMTPVKSQTYTFGVGYSTDVQFRGTVGIDLPRLNESGHRFKSLLQASGVENNLQAQYTIPGRDPVAEQYHFAASIFNLDYDDLLTGGDITSRAAKLSAGYAKTFGDWQQLLSMNLLYESFVIPPCARQKVLIPYPSLSWSYTTTDDIFFPTKGYTFNISLLGAHQVLLSDVNFAQAEIDGKFIHSLTPSTRAVFKGSLGYTAIKDINTLPPSLQFFTGGIQSLRGYAYQSIGPGKYSVTGSAELQQEIFDKWWGSVFYDVGDVFNNSVSFKRSWGIGLIRETIVGPVRLGVAQGLDRPGKPFRLIFSIGPDF